MVIEGLTTCVGELYSSFLQRGLPGWLDGLDTLTVVTSLEDRYIEQVCHGVSTTINVVRTSLFTDYNAFFNKGAALNIGYRSLKKIDYILHIDSDILLPLEWRKQVESSTQLNCLHGSQRFDSLTHEPLDKPPLYPFGYFHLWNSNDPLTLHWPLFDTWHPHAGNYDADFADRWPKHKRVDLGLHLLHQGTPRTHWYGPHAHPAYMQVTHMNGLLEVKELAKKGYDRLNTPPPVIQLLFPLSGGIPWVKEMLQLCSLYGPFDIIAKATTSNTNQHGWQLIPTSTTASQLKGILSSWTSTVPIE